MTTLIMDSSAISCKKEIFISNECAISCKSGFILIRKWCEIWCKKSHFVQKLETVAQENLLFRGNYRDEGGGAKHTWAPQADLRSLLIRRRASWPTPIQIKSFPSLMLRLTGSLTMSIRPAIRYPITNIWLLHPPKDFFGKISTCS